MPVVGVSDAFCVRLATSVPFTYTRIVDPSKVPARCVHTFGVSAVDEGRYDVPPVVQSPPSVGPGLSEDAMR